MNEPARESGLTTGGLSIGGLDYDRIRSSALRTGDPERLHRDYTSGDDPYEMYPFVDQMTLGNVVSGAAQIPPFKLSVAEDGGTYYWSVLSDNSCITDGTNGTAIDLSAAGFDTDNAIAASKYIVLQATVTLGVASSWALTAVDLADATEVGVTGTPAAQNKVRLIIGSVMFEDGQVFARQAVFSPQILTDGFYNGLLVKILENYKIHPSYL